MASLFGQVVDCCGLAPAFARKIVLQACERGGVSAEALGPAELIHILPWIQLSLGAFLEPREVAQKVAAIRRLVQRSWRSLPPLPRPDPDADARAAQGPRTKSTS